MTAPTSASLAAHLAAVHGLPAADAAAAVDAFVEDVYGQCLDQGAAVYPGLGTFRLAASGLAFAPDPALALVVNHRFAGLDAAPAARPEAPLPAFAPLVAAAPPPAARPSVPVVPVVPVAIPAPPPPAYAPPVYVPTGYAPTAPPPVAPPPPPTYAELPDDDTPAPRTRLLPTVLVGLMLLLGAMAAYGWWTMRTPQPALATVPPLAADTSASTPPTTFEPFEPTPDTAASPPVAPASVAPAPSPAPAPRVSAPPSAPASRPAARASAPRVSHPAPSRASRPAAARPAPTRAPRVRSPSASCGLIPAAMVALEAGDAMRLTPPSEREALVGEAGVVADAGGYTVVAGGAATMAMAERMAEPLRVAGFRVAVLPGTTDDGRTIWRVCVGQFPGLGPATVALRRLRGDVLPTDAWLLSLQSNRFRD